LQPHRPRPGLGAATSGNREAQFFLLKKIKKSIDMLPYFPVKRVFAIELKMDYTEKFKKK
jgi:hypothetical protein